MANRTIYTRTYSKNSAGQLVSGKGPKGGPLSEAALLEEFPNQANEWNREPTALVSASNRIVDTVKRAFDEHYERGESPADIWIAFIEVPSTIDETATRIHSAQELAEKCGLPGPSKFMYEVVFEWAIPEKYVVHKVSLQTLMERGLQKHCFLQPKTVEVRRCIAREFQRSSPWEIGNTLGLFARKFGARAPLNWIAHQLFHDCVRARIVDDDVVRLKYAHKDTETVDFQYFCDLDDGIDTSLCDWWLLDINFVLDCEEFEEWRDVTEDSITWDLIELWETWNDADWDGTIKELSAKEELLNNEAENKLLAEHGKKKAAIEAEAVKIGL